MRLNLCFYQDCYEHLSRLKALIIIMVAFELIEPNLVNLEQSCCLLAVFLLSSLSGLGDEKQPVFSQ